MYTVDYFIKKVENTPENKIITFKFDNGVGGHCINGMCGIRSFLDITEEARDLQKLFSNLIVTLNDGWKLIYNSSGGIVKDGMDLVPPGYSEIAAVINNGQTNEYPQPTPKQRILAALYDIKAKLEPIETKVGPIKERIVYVGVPISITEQVEELIFN